MEETQGHDDDDEHKGNEPKGNQNFIKKQHHSLFTIVSFTEER